MYSFESSNQKFICGLVIVASLTYLILESKVIIECIVRIRRKSFYTLEEFETLSLVA